MASPTRKQTGRVSSAQLAQDLATDGGFTVHEATGDRPKVGFAIADFGAEERVPAPGASVSDIERYRQRESARLAGDKKFLGGWRNDDEGRGHEADYLDVSTVVGTRREAFDQGQRTAQRAVMDLATFEEHSVPFKPGLPGPKRTGQKTKEYRADEARNRELGRSMVEHQLHGRQDPTQAKSRGEAIADALIEREGIHTRVRGMNPRAKRGR